MVVLPSKELRATTTAVQMAAPVRNIFNTSSIDIEEVLTHWGLLRRGQNCRITAVVSTYL
jgi:hypothetical protein